MNDLDKITQQVNGQSGNRSVLFRASFNFSPLPYLSPTLPISTLFMNVCMLMIYMLIKHSNNMKISRIISRSHCLPLHPTISFSFPEGTHPYYGFIPLYIYME